MLPFAPGVLAFIRDEKWLICRLDPATDGGHERDNWCDTHGRIVLSNSKGLVGVDLPLKGGRNTPRTRITYDGKVREGKLGVEDLCTYVAPFTRSNREDALWQAWVFFEGQTKISAEAASVH